MIGVIIFAYGAPGSLDNLKEYYTHIRHGNAPSEEEMAAVKEQYRNIGTTDLLGSITERQAEALTHSLQPYFEEEVKVYTAFKHTAPFVEDTVLQMVNEGVSQVITFPIKPLYSKTGTGLYQIKVRKALAKLGSTIPVLDVDHWHLHDEFVSVMAKRVKTAVKWLPSHIRNETTVIFTAHSQPGKPETYKEYSEEFTELGKSIANQLQLKNWRIAYRSAGSHEDLWSGPDVKDVIQEEGKKGIKGVVACDLLSVTSNIEVLYDIGYDCQLLCKRMGIEFIRTEIPNDSYDFIMALTTIVKERVILNKLTEEYQFNKLKPSSK
ncbi:ferrochelatase [Evansella vedderi]|nr:ferrochelatase [Evansella vedderi]